MGLTQADGDRSAGAGPKTAKSSQGIARGGVNGPSAGHGTEWAFICLHPVHVGSGVFSYLRCHGGAQPQPRRSLHVRRLCGASDHRFSWLVLAGRGRRRHLPGRNRLRPVFLFPQASLQQDPRAGGPYHRPLLHGGECRPLDLGPESPDREDTGVASGDHLHRGVELSCLSPIHLWGRCGDPWPPLVDAGPDPRGGDHPSRHGQQGDDRQPRCQLRLGQHSGVPAGDGARRSGRCYRDSGHRRLPHDGRQSAALDPHRRGSGGHWIHPGHHAGGARHRPIGHSRQSLLP